VATTSSSPADADAPSGGPADAASASPEEPPSAGPAPLPAVATTPPRSARRRPRWAVPALAVLLVLAVVAAIGLLVLGPRIIAAPPPPGPTVSGLAVLPVPGPAGGGS
jgi:hypothetical protein